VRRCEELHCRPTQKATCWLILDWIQDSLHEQRLRRKGPPTRSGVQARLDQMDGVPGALWNALSRILDDGQTWVVISLVGELMAWATPEGLAAHDAGVGIGISAALMSIMTVWLSDIKMGYCTTGWWLTQKFCCLEISDEGEACAEWRNWGGVEPFRYLAYILFAVSRACRGAADGADVQGLFSFSAAFLVKSFAPYAAGSGISEIKCILGGFIIKGFLSAETFALKTLTMVSCRRLCLARVDDSPSVSRQACLSGRRDRLCTLRAASATSRRGCSNGTTGVIVSCLRLSGHTRPS